MRVSEVILEVNDVGQLLVAPDSLFYGKRTLNPDAEGVIIEEATMTSSSDHIHLKIQLRRNEISGKDEVSTSIHQHFLYRRKNRMSGVHSNGRLICFVNSRLKS